MCGKQNSRLSYLNFMTSWCAMVLFYLFIEGLLNLSKEKIKAKTKPTRTTCPLEEVHDVWLIKKTWFNIKNLRSLNCEDPKYLISTLRCVGRRRGALGADALTADVCKYAEKKKPPCFQREMNAYISANGLPWWFCVRSHFNFRILPHDLSKPAFTDE